MFLGIAGELVGTAGALGLAIILLSSTDSEPVAPNASTSTNFTSIGIVQTRGQVEQESLEALEQANRQIENLLASLPADAATLDRNYTISQMQSIINKLEKVQTGTTAYSRAQELLRSAKNKLKQLQP